MNDKSQKTRTRFIALGLMALTLLTPALAQDTAGTGGGGATTAADNRDDSPNYGWVGLLGLAGLAGLLKKPAQHVTVREAGTPTR